MTNPKIDVLFVGNAIMDVLCSCEDSFLIDYGIEKGGMNLIDEERALYLYNNMPNKTEQCGGSAAKARGSCLGGKAGFQARLQLTLSVTVLSRRRWRCQLCW